MDRGRDLRLALTRVERRSLTIGLVALAACLGGALVSVEQFFRSYLLAYLFWLGLALGCLAIVMLHHLVRGAWGYVIRRLLESGSRTLALMVLLFVPLLFGLSDLYPWARPEAMAGDELLRHKAAYLNVPFFVLRTFLYFLLWVGLVYFLTRWSRQQDRDPKPSTARRLRLLSGPGLVLYGLTVTFASIDWVMSLEPHWYSLIYGLVFIVGQVLGTLAFVIVVTASVADREPFADVLTPMHFHDLGNLLLAFVMLWAYVAFSQYLIIWSGNLPEEIPWYLHRMRGGWGGIGAALIAFHFALPFLLLLHRDIKRTPRKLLGVASAVLVMRWVDLFWLVVPAFHPAGVRFHWMDLAAAVGLGGIWVAVFLQQLKGAAFLPRRDLSLEGVVHHG